MDKLYMILLCLMIVPILICREHPKVCVNLQTDVR